MNINVILDQYNTASFPGHSHYGCYFLFHRDRITDDDYISSAWLPISKISALGEDGWFTH